MIMDIPIEINFAEIDAKEKKKIIRTIKKIARLLAKQNLEPEHEIFILTMFAKQYKGQYTRALVKEIIQKLLTGLCISKTKACEACPGKLTCPKSISSLQ